MRIQGADSLAWAELGKAPRRAKDSLHVARDASGLDRLQGGLRFRARGARCWCLPAWGLCLRPAVRIPTIVAERLGRFVRLATPETRPAGPHRVARRARPCSGCRASLTRVGGRLRRGQTLDVSLADDGLGENGTVRSENRDGAGEFAVRGGLLDLFPTGKARAYAARLFGRDRGRSARSIRMSQPSDRCSRPRWCVLPVSEVC